LYFVFPFSFISRNLKLFLNDPLFIQKCVVKKSVLFISVSMYLYHLKNSLIDF
jgi:hypothetical protein